MIPRTRSPRRVGRSTLICVSSVGVRLAGTPHVALLGDRNATGGGTRDRFISMARTGHGNVIATTSNAALGGRGITCNGPFGMGVIPTPKFACNSFAVARNSRMRSLGGASVTGSNACAVPTG